MLKSMDKENWKKIESIYDQACLLDSEKQQTFVKDQSGGNNHIYHQVMKMLNTDAEGFMQSFPGEIAGLHEFDTAEPTKIGHFEIIKKIATGGMGRVYLAQSTMADVPIKVALKTIRVELINEELKHKFQNEKNILSKLQHKNIASLIDAGVTNNQIPYIATEWVKGKNIKDYCIENNLSIKKRLKIFLQICDAMIFAHNKLIIHRDLKPDNILVNDQKQVKLLDFGIAKIVDENQNVQTQTQIFTPDYAAPEQVNGEMCTAATDIYSLGVILFEILTNSKRFNLTGLAITEKIKAITISKSINITGFNPEHKLPYSVSNIKGALLTIINKAMHIDPDRRYNSVSSLISDVDSYLDKRPIKAMNDSYWYKFKMLIARNKLSSIFVFFALVSATLGSILTIKQLNEKLIEVQKSQQITDFLIDSIQASDPDITKGKNVSVIEFLQNAKIRTQDSGFDDERITSSLKTTIAIALTKVGEYKDAEKLLVQSISNENINSKSHIALANLYLEQKSFALADKELSYLQENNKWLSQTEKVQTKQLAAKVLLNQGEFEQAIKIIQTTLTIQTSHKQNLSKLIESKLILATILDEYDRVDESTKILRETLELSQTTYGVVSTHTTQILEQLARNLSNSSPVPWDEVFELYQRSLKNQMQIYGDDHPIVAKSLLNEGFAYKFMGDLEKASGNVKEARNIAINNFGEKHILTAHIDLLSSQLNILKGNLNQAISQLEKVLKVYILQYGENHFTTNQVNTTLSAYLIKANRGKEALAKLLPMYQSQKEQLGENHKAVFYVKLNIIKAYNQLKRYDQSVDEGLIALNSAKQHIGSENILTIGIQIELAKSYINKHMPKEAIVLCNELLKYEQIINNQNYNNKVLDLISQAKAFK
jgi:serine/threonine protein kinase